MHRAVCLLTSQLSLHGTRCDYPRRDGQAELTWLQNFRYLRQRSGTDRHRPSDREQTSGVGVRPLLAARAYHRVTLCESEWVSRGLSPAACGSRRAYHSAVVVVDDVVLMQSQRHRDCDGRHPHGSDDEQTAARRQPRSERVNYREVAVDGNRHGRQSRHVNTHTHDHRHDVAQHLHYNTFWINNNCY